MGVKSSFRAKFVPKSHKVGKKGFRHEIGRTYIFGAKMPDLRIFTNKHQTLIKTKIIPLNHI